VALEVHGHGETRDVGGCMMMWTASAVMRPPKPSGRCQAVHGFEEFHFEGGEFGVGLMSPRCRSRAFLELIALFPWSRDATPTRMGGQGLDPAFSTVFTTRSRTRPALRRLQQSDRAHVLRAPPLAINVIFSPSPETRS